MAVLVALPVARNKSTNHAIYLDFAANIPSALTDLKPLSVKAGIVQRLGCNSIQNNHVEYVLGAALIWVNLMFSVIWLTSLFISNLVSKITMQTL